MRPVIHWEFTRGTERVICQVERDATSGAFAVALVACRGLRRASIGTFQAVAAALRRHAAVANELRSAGWKLAAYTR
ncbi:MAG TPA: hypothetical protein VN700_03860 [Vicinamibacterales bacterium]|nr:hypothetical protein [Vicinamibacterales bacterium]